MDKITQREKEILKALKNDPMVSQEDLADKLGITRSAVAVHISNLTRKGFILGRGYVFSDRTGVLVLGPVLVEVNGVPGDTGRGDEIYIGPGGAAYRISQALGCQDVPTSLVSVVGRDDWGEAIADKLRKSGVDTRHLTANRDYPTPKRIRLKDGGGWQILADQRALDCFTPEYIQNLGVTISNSRMIVLDTEMPSAAFERALAIAREAAVSICIRYFGEAGPVGCCQDFNGVYMTVMDQAAAGRLLGQRVRDLDDAVSAGKRLNEKGVGLAVIVIPELGAALTGIGEAETVPILPVPDKPAEISPDYIVSGLISGILQGRDFRQSLRIGIGIATNFDGKYRNMSFKQEKM